MTQGKKMVAWESSDEPELQSLVRVIQGGWSIWGGSCHAVD